MTNTATPGAPGDIDPRHLFLTAKEVILRYGWGRTAHPQTGAGVHPCTPALVLL
jgi:hypothetical protein